MRVAILIFAACLLALGVQMSANVLFASSERLDDSSTGQPSPDPKLARRMTDLENEIRMLKIGLAEQHAGREAVPVPGSEATSSGSTGVPVSDAPDGRRFLELYIRSFDSTPKGSEFFRLAVDAWARDLVIDLAGVIADRSQPLVLRQNLVAMLGTGRFAGKSQVIRALLDGAWAGPDSLAVSAIRALAAVGNLETIAELESLFARIGYEGRKATIATIKALSKIESNTIFLRLLKNTGDAATRALIIANVANTDPETTAPILRDAFQRGVPERTAAAKRLFGMFGEPFLTIVADQLRIETNRGVRSLLERARRRMASVPAHHPLQATGPPNADPNQDDHRAWATGNANGGDEWLEVGFSRALRATSIRIHEVSSAGAVTQVVVIDTRGRSHTVWKGTDPTTRPGVFAVPIQPTAFAVKLVHIVLDTSLRDGWNEIDAVQLVGIRRSAWASTATSSSYYGSGWHEQAR